MQTLLTLLARIVLVAMGLVVAGAVAAAAALLAAVWGLRSVWNRLVGRPAPSQVAGFRTRAGAGQRVRGNADVIDVEPRQL